MIDDSKGARRARLRHTLVKAGRGERAPNALRSRLLESAAASSVATAAGASSAASGATVMKMPSISPRSAVAADWN